MHSPLISGQDDNFSPTRLTCSNPDVLDEYMTSLIGYGVGLGIIFETHVEFESRIYDILIHPIPSIKYHITPLYINILILPRFRVIGYSLLSF